MSSGKRARPKTKDFAGNPGGFVEAVRAWRGLPYRKFAVAANQSVRGTHRRTSENYLYRLCHGQAQLNADVIDGIARALALQPAEVTFLRHACGALKIAAPRDPEARRDYGRALLKGLGQGGDTRDVAAMQALIDPLVVALYTYLGRPRPAATLLKQVARGLTSVGSGVPQVRAALERLANTGVVETRAGNVGHTNPGSDLSVHVGSGLSDALKSQAMKLFYGALDEWGATALFRTARERRHFASQTFLVRDADVPAATAELAQAWREAVQRIRNRYQSDQGDVVLHAGLRVWPMIDATTENNGKPRRAR